MEKDYIQRINPTLLPGFPDCKIWPTRPPRVNAFCNVTILHQVHTVKFRALFRFLYMKEVYGLKEALKQNIKVIDWIIRRLLLSQRGVE